MFDSFLTKFKLPNSKSNQKIQLYQNLQYQTQTRTKKLIFTKIYKLEIKIKIELKIKLKFELCQNLQTQTENRTKKNPTLSKSTVSNSKIELKKPNFAKIYKLILKIKLKNEPKKSNFIQI